MSFLKFNKEKLVNLEYSLSREILETSKSGGYMSSTIVGCNTRKYHGLLVVPIKEFGYEKYVLLSSLDETIIQHGQNFNFAIHKYPNAYEPRGHKYLVDYSCNPVSKLTYRVGGVLLEKEIIIVAEGNQIMIKYTLVDAHSDTVLRLKPFVAYRRIHELTHKNDIANTSYGEIDGGVRVNLYRGFPDLNMQVSKPFKYNSMPDWYKNIEYIEEQKRGYDYSEDLFVPGYFDINISKGESVIFSASTDVFDVTKLNTHFAQWSKKHSSRDTFENCLRYSARQFVVRNELGAEISAGYPWFGAWGRDTFIALPGVTLSAFGDVQTCKEVLDTMLSRVQNGLFPNVGDAYNSVDAPMWLFKALQEYGRFVTDKVVWADYGTKMKEILMSFRNGIDQYIYMDTNALIWASHPNKALTWCDAVVGNSAVTPRRGYPVEVNALWYNAVCYTLKLAYMAKDFDFVASWSDIPLRIEQSFNKVFWLENEQYLADYVDEYGKNSFVRPNQIFACSLEFSPLCDERKHKVLEVVKRDLLTEKGLRTLSPKNSLYVGRYEGDQSQRDSAYHQGTVWPWLLGAYIEANFRLFGSKFVPKAKRIMTEIQEDISVYGVGSIGEVYDGNPPYQAGGCISQAWSVGEVLRSLEMIKSYEKIND